MPFGWAILGAAAIGATGQIIGAQTQASGQEQAANTQAGMFNKIVGQEQPFLSAGQGATTALNQLLGTAPGTGPGGTAASTGLPAGYLTQQFAPTQEQLNNYPGYQFALQTGGQAVRNADTPGVGALSGPALKDLMSFDVGTANQYYGQYFNQFQTQQNNIFNRLQQIASLGQNAAGNLGSAGANLGTGIAQAQAAAAGSIGGGIAGASGSLGNAFALNTLLNSGQPSGLAGLDYTGASQNALAEQTGGVPSLQFDTSGNLIPGG